MNCASDSLHDPRDAATTASARATRPASPSSPEARISRHLSSSAIASSALAASSPARYRADRRRRRQRLVGLRAMTLAGYEFLDLVEKQVQHDPDPRLEAHDRRRAARRIWLPGYCEPGTVRFRPERAHRPRDEGSGSGPESTAEDRGRRSRSSPASGRGSNSDWRRLARGGPNHLEIRFIFDAARRIEPDQDAFTPMGFERLKELLVVLATDGPRRRLDRRIRAVQDEARDALGIRRGEL